MINHSGFAMLPSVFFGPQVCSVLPHCRTGSLSCLQVTFQSFLPPHVLQSLGLVVHLREHLLLSWTWFSGGEMDLVLNKVLFS